MRKSTKKARQMNKKQKKQKRLKKRKQQEARRKSKPTSSTSSTRSTRSTSSTSVTSVTKPKKAIFDEESVLMVEQALSSEPAFMILDENGHPVMDRMAIMLEVYKIYKEECIRSTATFIYWMNRTKIPFFNCYRYPKFKHSKIYNGMPAPDVNLPLAGSILLKLQWVPISTIWWGTKKTPNGLEEDISRQYEFCLREGDDWAICFLYVKGVENHFKSECLQNLPLVHGGHSQRIPLIYSILSQMDIEEQRVIWFDLD